MLLFFRWLVRAAFSNGQCESRNGNNVAALVERRAVPLPDQLRALQAAKHRYQQRANHI